MNSVCQNNRNLNRESGFTLIEVMIAVSILVIIVFLTSRSVTDASKLKEQLASETEVNSDLRAGYFLLDRDMTQIFTPLSLMPIGFKPLDPYNQEPPPTPPPPGPGGKVAPTPFPPPTVEEVNRIFNGSAFQTYEFWGPVVHASGVRGSRFKGNNERMSFVSMSHKRVYAEKKESIFSKVTYSMDPSVRTKGLLDLNKSEETLAFRLEDPRDSTTNRKFPILTGLKSMKIEYFKKDKKDPLATWDSEQQVDTKGEFPESIRFTFVLVDREGRQIDQQWLFRLEVRNNALPGTL